MSARPIIDAGPAVNFFSPELAAAVDRISGLPMAERKRQARDLGEIMVIAHAVVAAETGQSVVMLIDDGAGARLATQEINRLHRLRNQGKSVGTVIFAGTLTILRRAAGTEHLPDKAAMRTVFDGLRACDDGLPPIANTGLLSRELWA